VKKEKGNDKRIDVVVNELCQPIHNEFPDVNIIKTLSE
jgi:hypothetical protein